MLLRRMTKMLKERPVFKKLIWFAVAATAVVLDQLTKNAVTSVFSEVGENVTVIRGILDFTYVRNRGATAGILADNRWVFMSASAVIIVAIAIYLAVSKKESFFGGICLSMIMGGGIGNMIDRIAMGEVVDFLDVTATDIFPFNCIFNVADVFVCIGCILFVLSFILDEIKQKKESEKPSDVDGTCD